MPKQHSALFGNDLHQPKGIGVETTAEFLIISQSSNIISGSSTSTGSFGRVEATTLGGTLTTAAQTNITSVGTLAGVNITAPGSSSPSIDISQTQSVINSTIIGASTPAAGTFTTVTTSGNISGSSTSTASFGTFVGDGSSLTGITSFAGSAGTETSFSGSAVSTGSFGRVEATKVAGTLTTAAQTNITSVGTLGGLEVNTSSDLGHLNIPGSGPGTLNGVAIGSTSGKEQSGAFTTVTTSGNISGSSTSTGSFGHIMKGGVNWDTAVSASAATAGFGADLFTSAGISGSFTQPSSSFSTRVTDLENPTSVTADFGGYTFSTSSAQATWNITHNLNSQYPNVTVYDSSDEVIIPLSITANTVSSSTIVFNSPVSGKAHYSVGGNMSGSSTSTGSFGKVLGDGSSLTGISAGFDYTSGSSPVVTTNPSSLGATWINTTSGEIFVCHDITTGANEWLGTAGTEVAPVSAAYFGSRGLWGGGYSPNSNVIDYVTIATTGNATDFGDLTAAVRGNSACSNGTRGVFGGGYSNDTTNVIDYVTISTPGNAIDFGDLTVARWGPTACSDGTKGLWGGGYASSYSNVIDYITIATTGNAIDFGDLTVARYWLGACSDGTKGVWGGGNSSTNVIDYITIATTGNATDFGDLTVARYWLGACSDGTKGVFGGGYPTYNVIDYVTIATTGNAIDFGDLTVGRRGIGSCSDGTKGVWGGGNSSNVIDYVTIATTGNAIDFGDLTVSREGPASCSGT